MVLGYKSLHIFGVIQKVRNEKKQQFYPPPPPPIVTDCHIFSDTPHISR